MYVAKPNVVKSASSFSPASLHSLAFMASLSLPTSELKVLPPKKYKQIKAFKEAPGRYSLVQESISSKRIGDFHENDYGRSGYSRSDQEFRNLLMYHRGDSVVMVDHYEDDLNKWAIGRIWRDWWSFTINGNTSQVDRIFFDDGDTSEDDGDLSEDDRDCQIVDTRNDGWIEEYSSTFKAEVDKDGNVNSEFIISQQRQKRIKNPVQFDIEIKISFEENRMDINVRGENEHFVGEFSGQYIKLDQTE